ncbi:MAG: SAM-dependent methyltransferase [Xanthomonadales bacterium]|nr:SAM-dependent methyltransferase [Gammaproteobacteria bacterium]MBT8053718.1 SAM-dependent methyltransferase [Gammaproteobacteria bacterium]NND56731.1 SAM-dependent methyltransferase [Xanthomonadales bacterium]NNK50973.1 SAM-dependent methyltransferase [Xanthomonadales bacterium]
MNQSREVSSTQQDVHPRLDELLSRHLANEWSQPLHPPTIEAFQALEERVDCLRDHIVLDSGCGTGASTRRLARALPDCVVIGVDKSVNRLSRSGAEPYPRREGNAVFVRAELTTFWRLALRAGWRVHRHYLLYPNPWPKPGHLQRRWHAHPVFPDMLRLGGRLEMRCNWDIYALEFAHGVNRVLGVNVRPGSPPDEPVMSPFERKYRNSGHRIYSVVVSCGSSGVK